MIEIYKREVRRAIEKIMDAEDILCKIKLSLESVGEEQEDFDSLEDALSSISDALYYAKAII